MLHKGQIVKNRVDKSKYSLTKLAKNLGISRNTLYNRFNSPDLSHRFILEVGNVIHYDFTIDFPEIQQNADRDSEKENVFTKQEDKAARLWRLEDKHNVLLERYSKLLELLIKISNEHGIHDLKHKIITMDQKKPIN